MADQPKNLREVADKIRKQGKEISEKVNEQLAPAKQRLQAAARQIRENFGVARYTISRFVSDREYTDRGDPDFDELQKAIDWCVQASKGKADRFDIVEKVGKKASTTRIVKSVSNGVVSDPPDEA